MVAVHNVVSSFPFLQVDGLGLYGDRAMLLNRRLVVAQSGQSLDPYTDYLRRVGIGADRVVQVDRMYEDAAQGRVADAIRGAVRDGATIQLFHTIETEKAFVAELGLDWCATENPYPTLTDPANCKATLRTIAGVLGSGHHVPPHQLCRTPQELHQAFRVIRDINTVHPYPDGVILKRPDLASGDGMEVATHPTHVDGFAGRHVDGHRQVIAEAFYRDHLPASYQWTLTDRGPVPQYASSQIMARDGKTHMGNYVASGNRIPHLSRQEVRTLRKISAPIARFWWHAGYRGPIGFDFIGVMFHGTRRWYMVETNGRYSASRYAYEVGLQVASRLGGSWAVAMSNVYPAPGVATSFEELSSVLGELLFDGETGALPFLVRLLPDKFAVMCIARTWPVADRILHAVQKRVACIAH